MVVDTKMIFGVSFRSPSFTFFKSSRFVFYETHLLVFFSALSHDHIPSIPSLTLNLVLASLRNLLGLAWDNHSTIMINAPSRS